MIKDILKIMKKYRIISSLYSFIRDRDNLPKLPASPAKNSKNSKNKVIS